MTIVALDDEENSLKHLYNTIIKVVPDAVVVPYLKQKGALDYVSNNNVDVIFSDIAMPGMDGIEFAKVIKNVNPKINIIFVTGFSEYAGKAFSVYPSGYINKPVNEEDIKRELDNLRYPVYFGSNRIKATCFGNFDFFVDGKTVSFKRSKSKELLAYLICKKGSGITKKEAVEVLFQDKEYTAQNADYLNKIVTDLSSSLKEVNADSILIKKYNYYAIDPSKFTCDYFEYCNGNISAINSYKGDFLTQYDWATRFMDLRGGLKITHLETLE